MNRRNFLKNSAAAGIGAGIFLQGCNSETQTPAVENTKVPGRHDFPLNELSVDYLQQKMASGQLSSTRITEFYLKRIEELDRNGVKLNSVIELNPDALQIAGQLDEERKQGKTRGPLHGIPVLIKDNIDTADKMMTTAGSLALEGNIALKDAFIIEKLRNAGAVILGKTNLSEWANFRSTRSSSGWSSRGGQTLNPYVLDRNPCGSSSGSAAAVAANLCAVAVGTETDGSVTAPASFCGIVGMKPTVGLLSRSGIIPISATQDTAGPMARTVKDAAILLSAMTGTDKEDPVTLRSEKLAGFNFAGELNPEDLHGKIIGVEKDFLSGHEQIVVLYKAAVEKMKAAGAVILEVSIIAATKTLGDAELEVLLHEFKDGVNRYLKTSNAPLKSLEEVIAFNKKEETRVMPWFKQELLELSQATGGLSAKYSTALKKSKGAAAIIDRVMRTHKLDAICGVTIGPANLIDLLLGDYPTGPYFCPPAAMAGYPHITVPMGTVSGLPVGLSFMARAWEDHKLLKLAYAYEQLTRHRTPPRFLNNIHQNGVV